MGEGRKRLATVDGRERRLRVLLGALLFVVLAGVLVDGVQAAERRVALVIGNGAYDGAERLDTPRQDADDVSAALGKLGFSVISPKPRDLDQRGMEQVVQKFADASRGADVALFYYAGHGVGRGGDNWLIPVGSKITDPADLRYRAVSLRWIADRLKASGAGARLLIVDACRNNRWYEAERGPGQRGLERITPPSGTLIAYAAAPGETARDKHPTRPNGLFTGELVQALAQEPEVDIRELIRRVGERVNRLNAGQHPSTEEIGFYAALHLAEPKPVADPRGDEDAAWQQARQGNSRSAYEAYLARYPQGRYADWAQQEIARLARPVQPPVASQATVAASAPTVPAARPSDYPPGKVFRDCSDCPEMVAIPAGEFVMGSPASETGRYEDEGPQLSVTIARPFAVGKYEVTFDEWDACAAAGACDHRPYDDGWGRGRQPVINVSWHDALSYLAWLSRTTGKRYRLPSEAEWEYAARADSRSAYPWGEVPGSGQANFDGSGSRWSGKQTAPAGSFAANGFGLHDMIGNVWEWVQDCYQESYMGAPTDGSAREGSKCEARVLRGGSWLDDPQVAHSAFRGRDAPAIRDNVSGFRLARTLP
jgi:formylglycine-generating enzyme required for sulfatase activity